MKTLWTLLAAVILGTEEQLLGVTLKVSELAHASVASRWASGAWAAILCARAPTTRRASR